MTSVPSQQQSPAQNSSSAAQSAAPVPAPSSSSGTSSQQAAAGRSFGNSVKRQGTSPNPAALAHGRSESISQSNGKASILPAVPTLGGPTIVNGNNAVSPVSQQPEHSRKSSVTISATGASGQMPNGGPVAGKPGIGNGIQVQFGSMTAGTSPSLNNSAPLMGPNSGSLAVASSPNPRVSSPAQSPSPIPQPAASGGRPPSSLYPQGNGPSFGSIGDDSRQARASISGMPTGSLTPGLQSTQLRRESSQQSNSDMANGNMGMNGGRGGYPSQGGRGRGGGYPPPNMSQQMSYSPGPNYRSIPNAPRGAQAIPSPFLGQGNRPIGPYPHSPQAARSPALAHPQPMHQASPMPMQSPGMPGQPFPGYPPQMGPPQVNPQFHSATTSFAIQPQKAPPVAAARLLNANAAIALPKTLSPESGQFEEFLTKHQQGQYIQYHDGSFPYYPGTPYGVPPHMQMQPFPSQHSPRPSFGNQPGQPPYVANQYGPPMSRTPSGVAERPPSTTGQPQTPMTPAVNLPQQHQQQSQQQNRAVSSPGPKSTEFHVPKKKGTGVVIKDPSSGLVKTFNKAPESPAPTAPSKSPVTVSSASTPPSRTPVHGDSHTRTDSKSVRDAEITRKFQEQIATKLEADKAQERTKHGAEATDKQDKQETEAKTTQDVQVKPPHEAPLVVDVEAFEEDKPAEEAKAAEAEKSEDDATAAAPTPRIEEPKVETEEVDETAEQKLVEESKVEPEESEESEDSKEPEEPQEPEVDEDSDEYWARIEAEEQKRQEEEEKREREYQAKKKAEAEEKARKEVEAAASLDEELKKAEREAEAREEERLKKLEGNEADDGKEKDDLFAALKKSDNAFKATKSTAVDTPASGVATPASDASSMGPPAPKAAGQAKQKPAALKLKTAEQVEAPQPSAALQSLRSARFLQKIDEKTYPPAIASPNPALNSAAPMGKFRYDKNFLMQFQNVFTEKPSETWNEKVKETVGDTSDTPASARPRGGPQGTMPPRSASRPSIANPFQTFGAFNNPRTIPPGTTSEARFAASNQQMQRGGPAGNLRYNPNVPGAFPVPFPSAMQRTPSSTSMGQPHSPRNNPSQRGSQRGSKAGKRDADKEAKTMPLTAGQEVKPIEVSASGWKPRSIGAHAMAAGPPPGGDGYLAPDVVQRKVKASLNKMTPTTFDKISNQILDIVMQSKRETDGRTLRQVIQLTFEKATDEAHWAQMYAEFCSRMLLSMTMDIKDETLGLDKNGKVNAGSTLFRKYLLNRCQQDFEAGWKSKLPDKPEGDTAEAAMLSDEYYTAAAAKRRGLGLVKFIGELYKLGMLTSRIMHMCVHRLLDYEGIPDEAEVESLTSLLKTIGDSLDAEEKSRSSMDAYFQRINDMLNVQGLPSRLKFMLMDIIDLRRAGWKGKGATNKGPATLDEVRAQAAAAEREKEAQRIAEASRRGGGAGGRMPMGRGDARNLSSNPMMPPPQQNSVDMNDLRRLGKSNSRQASSQGPMSFGPTSMFGTRGSNTRKTLGVLGRGGEDSGASSRTATPPSQSQKKEEKESTHTTNTFSALASLNPDEANDNPASPPSAASSPSLATARPAQQRQRSKSPLKDEDNA